MKALISIPDRTTRASSIEKAGFAIVRAATHSIREQRNQLSQTVYADDRLVNAILERGTAPLGTTTGNGFAAELAQNLVGEFLATLAPLSAAAAIMSQGLQVRMPAAASMKLPTRTGAPSAVAPWVTEGDPIPARSYAVNDEVELDPRKFAFIVGISRQVAKRANGEAVIRTLMREDAAASLDGSYFSTDAGDAATHAGLLNGVSAQPGYAGGDRKAIEEDLLVLSDIISAGGSGQLTFVVSPSRANRVRIKFPDLNRELTFLPSLAVPDSRIIALDPASLAHGAGDDFDIDASESATIHMSDDPAPIVDGATADPVRSMFQTDSIALRLIADVAFAPRRPNAVAYLEGATW